MEIKHSDKLQTSNPVCLADYCELFGCKTANSNFKIYDNNMKTKILNLEKCNEAKLLELRNSCLELSNQ
jgi:hypothetical protein